ncbi:MAG: XdhC/CoxI family protein [Acidobacteriota bacterium]
MRELLESIEAWRAEGLRVAVATIVKAWGSAPRPLGSKMAISERGDMAGSVSGGCVEGAVVEMAQAALEDGAPRLADFGISQDDAFAIGLSCGGTLDVLIEPLRDATYPALRDALTARRAVATVTRLDGPNPGASGQLLVEHRGAELGSLGDPDLDAEARRLVEDQWLAMAPRRFATDDGRELFIDVVPPPPKLIIVGAVHVAIVLVRMAKEVGFDCTVVDPRTAFATEDRFAHADRVVHDWPDEALRTLGVDANTFVVLLSHDLKLDVPALEVALPSARYIGALGSKKTHRKRLDRLRDAGVDPALFPRMHNPIGLDLGGRRAEEMAVSILAEIVAVNHGRDARPLPE